MPRRSSQATAIRDERAGAIYDTAARIIFEKGFDATSMSEIADAVELTKAGLYYYVKGKRELLFAIASFAMDLLDNEVVRPATRIADPEERLRAIVLGHARLLTREAGARGAVAILIDEVDGLSPEHREAIVERKRGYVELLRSTLAALAERRCVAGVDPTVAAFSLLGMVMWIARWYDPAGRLDGEAVAQHVTALAMASALATSDGERPRLEALPTTRRRPAMRPPRRRATDSKESTR